ncbi:MAG: hypothetical protein QXZ31_05320 [Thermofilaceae archaeon]
MRDARRVAGELLRLSGELDKVDPVLHRMLDMIAGFSEEEFERVYEHYDFGELLHTVRHYLALLGQMEERLVELLEKR